MFRDVHPGIPDRDLDFLPIPDPEVKKAPDPGSGSATLLFSDVTTLYFILKPMRRRII
jgi:hypothetical protein